MTGHRQYLIFALAVFAVVGGVAVAGATVDATTAATQNVDNTTNTSVNVTVDAVAQRVGVGHKGGATVRLTGAQNGVSAYELVLGVENGSVASIDGISVAGEGSDGPVKNVTYSDNETRAVVEVALLDATLEPANETDLMDVEVGADGVGNTTLAVLDVRQLADADVEEYDVSGVHNETVDVIPAVSLGIDVPANDIDVGGNVSSTVNVQGAVEGVSEYDITLSISNPTVGTITDVTVLPDGTSAAAANVTYEDNGSKVHVSVDGSNATRTPAETIDMLNVVVEGAAPGQTQLEVESEARLRGVNDTSYFVESTGAGTVSVVEPGEDDGNEDDAAEEDSSDGGDDASSSSGGGGGGGGGGTGQASMEITTKTTDFGAVASIENAESERVSLDVDVVGAASTPSVTGLELTPRSEPEKIDVYVYEPTAELATDATALGHTEPVGYVELDLRRAEPKNVDDIVVELTVPGEVLPDGGSLEDVAVYRYVDGAWTAANTSLEGEDSVRASLNGFGKLAVGVDTGAGDDGTTTENSATTAQTTSSKQTTVEETSTPEQTTAAETSAPEQTTSAQSETGGTTDGFGLLVMLVALGAVFVLKRRE